MKDRSLETYLRDIVVVAIVAGIDMSLRERVAKERLGRQLEQSRRCARVEALMMVALAVEACSRKKGKVSRPN